MYPQTKVPMAVLAKSSGHEDLRAKISKRHEKFNSWIKRVDCLWINFLCLVQSVTHHLSISSDLNVAIVERYILISIIERILPNGNEGWRLVALVYQHEPGEEILHSEDDLKKNWVCKLCNNMKKPTGRMGADVKDHINCCIEIERRILDKTSSGIHGSSSEEDINPSSSSSLSGDEESKEESNGEVILGTEVHPMFLHFAPFPIYQWNWHTDK